MLHLCSDCQRHVRELPCPFCGGEQSTAVLARPANARGLSRAALVMTAALAGTAAMACGSDDDGERVEDGGLSSGAAPVYGAPAPLEDAAIDDDATTGALYGGPPADGGLLEPDATPIPEDGGTAPAYGAPPGELD